LNHFVMFTDVIDTNIECVERNVTKAKEELQVAKEKQSTCIIS